MAAQLPPPPHPPKTRDAAIDYLAGPGMPYELEDIKITLKRGDNDKPGKKIDVKFWKNGPRNARDLWLHATKTYHDREYIVYFRDGTNQPAYRITYGDAAKQVAILANMMQKEFGVKKGSHVAIAMRNYPEYMLLFWALLSIGAVIVNINAWLTGPEMEYCITDGQSMLLFADGERAKTITPLLSKLGCPMVVLRSPTAIKNSKKVFNYDDLLKKYAKDVQLPNVKVDAEDDATIFYTSGTTGKPKGALGSHIALVGGALAMRWGTAVNLVRMGYDINYLSKYAPQEPQACALLPTPLFHVTAATATMVPYTYSGYKCVLMYKWDARAALQIIAQEKVMGMAAVPYMLLSILEHPDFEKYDTSSIAVLSSGGAPAPVTFPGTLAKKLPMRLPQNGWGMSETLIGIIAQNGIDYATKPNAIGRPIPTVEAKIVDAVVEGDSPALPPNKVGELCVRSVQVLKEYYRNLEATQKTITPDGWLRTGDLAYQDHDGDIFLVDRAKDMLIRGGENIYCVDVENCLYEHPGVLDCAVVGLPHRVLGEEVAAVVTLKPSHWGKVSTTDLMKHCKERIAAFKVPVFIELRKEELPRNANGKILKPILRDHVKKVAGAKL